MFKSRILFSAVLGGHRDQVRVNNNFRDEIQFYTDIIDVMYGWIHRESGSLREYNPDLWGWLLSYSYLLGSVNYLGGEQALCSVFQSVICFSYRETFFYANFTFSGEALFRLYRQSYPAERESGWRTRLHREFFPLLLTCRDEIFADTGYFGMSSRDLLCDYGRRNETQIQELHVLSVQEYDVITSAIRSRIDSCRDDAILDFLFHAIVLGGVVCYALLAHAVRCCCIRYSQARKRRKWRMKEAESSAMVTAEDKLEYNDQLSALTTQTSTYPRHKRPGPPPPHPPHNTFGTTNALTGNQILRYDGYSCTTPHIKVATV